MVHKSMPTEAEVFEYVRTLSNWGRWGAEDELGTVNMIDPEKRRQAVALVKEGVTVSCARPIVAEPAPDDLSPALHYMKDAGEGYAAKEWSYPGEHQTVTDFIGMAFHGASITHLDALCHVFWNGQMYNGRSSALVTTSQGATSESVEVLQDGVVSRGVLLDVPSLRGVDWIEPGDPVSAEELDAMESAQGVRVEQGDILLVRTGHLRRRNEVGPSSLSDGRPGLHAGCLPWLRERGVAMMGGDAINDVIPSGYPSLKVPVHQIGIVHMGLWLLDNCNLEELATACVQRGRWEFLLTIAPLRIRYGTGSPVNPIAMF